MSEFLALQWDSHQLCGLDAQIVGSKVRVRQSFVLSWPDGLSPWEQPEQAGALLKKELERVGAKSWQALVSLPREDAVVRSLELPNVPDDELPDVVRLQAATTSASSLDQLLLDYLPLPRQGRSSGRNVLMTTISRQAAGRLQTLCDAAGVRLLSIGISPVETVELINQLQRRRGIDPNETSLVIVYCGQQVEISMVRHECLLFAHAAHLDGDLVEEHNQTILSEISRSVVALDQSVLGDHMCCGWLLGTIAENSQLCDALRDRFSCDVQEILDPSAELNVAWEVSDASAQPGLFVAPLGMLLSQAQQTVERIDFLNPRKAAEKPDRRKMLLGIVAAGVLLAAAIGYGSLQLHLSDLDNAIAAKQKDEKKLKGLVKDGQTDLKSAARIGEWDDHNVNWLDQMGELNRVLGGTERIYLIDCRFRPSTRGAVASLRAIGFARQRRDVVVLHQRLAERHFRVNPYDIERSNKDSEYPYRFELNLQLVSATGSAQETTADRSKSASAPKTAETLRLTEKP